MVKLKTLITMRPNKFTLYITAIITALFFSALALVNNYLILSAIILASAYAMILTPEVQRELSRDPEED